MAIQTYDYSVLYKVFSTIIKDTQGLTMIELGGSGQIPAAPFVVFDIISPRIDIYEHYDVTERVPFEAVVSFTHYALKKLEALNLSENLRNQFVTDASLTQLRQADIVIAEVMPTNIRSIQNSTADKFMVGFDMRLRLRDPFVDEQMPQIDSVDVQEK